MRRNHAYLLLGFIGLFVLALSLAEAQSNLIDTASFSFGDNGGAVLTLTPGATISTGYAKVQPTAGPAMMEIVGFRSGATLIDEFVIPSAPSITSGRMYARLSGSVFTGGAFANPNNQSVTISYYFTDQSGTDSAAGILVINANAKTALFFNQLPFSGAPTAGTFTFTSDAPISVIGLRSFINERAEFLLTALPVTPLPSSSTETVIVPHWADGSGYTNRVVLINATDQVISGSAQFLLASGSAATLTVNGTPGNSFPYSIPAKSSLELVTSGGANLQTGSVRMTPGNGTDSPSAFSILSYKPSTITVSEMIIPAIHSDTAFRTYMETAGVSLSSGVVVTNPSGTPVDVTFNISSLSGSSLAAPTIRTIAGNGQLAFLAPQLFPSLPATVQGILRVSANSAVVPGALRFRINERGEFLFSGIPAIPESGAPDGVLPHVVVGGGYTSQVILFSRVSGPANSGSVKFINQAGGPMRVIKKFAGQTTSQ